MDRTHVVRKKPSEIMSTLDGLLKARVLAPLFSFVIIS